MGLAVHTRQIIDPVGGAKFTGTAGNVTLAALSALDQAPGRAWIGPEVNPNLGRDKLFTVGRAKYSFGASRYLGAIATDTEFAGTHNRVAGADVSWKLDDRQSLAAMALHSSTLDESGTARGGVAGHAMYTYSTRRNNVQALAEHYDTTFKMDTAYYAQTGFTRGWTYVDWSLYPDKKKHGWVRRVTPFLFARATRDRVAKGDEVLVIAGIRTNFSRQGFFRIDHFFGHEPWAGRSFSLDRWRLMGNGQVFRWLNLDGQLTFGDGTYYDPVAPFGGRMRQARLQATLQPTPRFSESISYVSSRLNRPTGEQVYSVVIINTRTTYQFTKFFFLRATIQYEGLQKRLLTDALASYELRPGTVLYAGYGSLIEQRDYQDGVWVPASGRYLTTQRGLFFKVSYLFRM
jgi:hypothetical protein